METVVEIKKVNFNMEENAFEVSVVKGSYVRVQLKVFLYGDTSRKKTKYEMYKERSGCIGFVMNKIDLHSKKIFDMFWNEGKKTTGLVLLEQKIKEVVDELDKDLYK